MPDQKLTVLVTRRLYDYLGESTLFNFSVGGDDQTILDYDGEKVFYGDLYFDLESEYKYHLKKKYKLTSQPLAKALGLHKNKDGHVLDATCGTGKDSVLLLSFGASVTAFERVPITYLLLEDAFKRLIVHYPELKGKFQLFFGESHTFQGEMKCDSFYFDPMYDHKRKSALPRKEMVFFKDLAGKDEDQQVVLTWAIKELKASKIVVKRALKAPRILENVNAQFKGKTTRYDLYLPSNS